MFEIYELCIKDNCGFIATGIILGNLIYIILFYIIPLIFIVWLFTNYTNERKGVTENG